MFTIFKNINKYFFFGCKLIQSEDKEFSLEFPEGAIG